MSSNQEILVKDCTKETSEDGTIKLSYKSKKWGTDGANRASMITIFIFVPVVMFTIISLNLGDFGMFLAFVGAVIPFLLLKNISRTTDTTEITNNGKISFSYIPYETKEISSVFINDVDPQASFVTGKYKGSDIKLSGFTTIQIAEKIKFEIDEAIKRNRAAGLNNFYKKA